MSEDKFQAYDMAILNLMLKHPECRTYESILKRAREDKYLETIVHNALNHLYDANRIKAIHGVPGCGTVADRNELTTCNIVLTEAYKITDNPHFEKLQDSISGVHLEKIYFK